MRQFKLNFIRPPQGVTEVAADALRVAGLLSVIAAGIWWTWTDAGVLALVLLGLVLPRFLAASAALDLAVCVALLVAGWSSVIDVYRAIAVWDLIVHFLTGGLMAAIVYLLLSSFHVVPDPDDGDSSLASVLVLTTAFGLATGAIWEMAEWVGHTYIDRTIFVGYDDSIGDMAIAGLGSLGAGFVLKYLPTRRPAVEA